MRTKAALLRDRDVIARPILGRHRFDARQCNGVVAFRCADDGPEAVAALPGARRECLAGEHHACEPGALAAYA
jgi:hypothetical protein